MRCTFQEEAQVWHYHLGQHILQVRFGSEFLMRNGHPYSYIDLERDPDVQNLLDTFQISASEDVEASLHFVIPLTKKSQTTLASTILLTKLKYVIWLEDEETSVKRR